MKRLTLHAICQIYPHCSPSLGASLLVALPGILEKYQINTPLRVAHFLGQTSHESGGMERLEENLHYSAERLLEVFGSHFHDAQIAAKYANKPADIANRVYADRMGNGDETSGDGWKFHGRGMMQLTGRDSYEVFSTHSGMDAIHNPNLLSVLPGGVESAAWFWMERQINHAADEDNVVLVTRLINGGELGLAERRELTQLAKRIIL